MSINTARHGRHARDRWQRGGEVAIQRINDEAKKHGTASRRTDLAVANSERVDIRIAGDEVARCAASEVAEGRPQIAVDGLDDGTLSAVADAATALRPREEQKAIGGIVREASRLSRFEITHRHETSGGVVVVVELPAVVRNDIGDAPAMIESEDNGLAILGDDAAIAHVQACAVGIDNRRDAPLNVELVNRAVAGDELPRCCLGCGRVERLGCDEVVEAISSSLELGLRRDELPAGTRVGHPPGRVPGDAGIRVFVCSEREGNTLASRDCGVRAGSETEGRIGTEGLPAGGGKIEGEVDDAPIETPARAKAAGGISGERVEASREG